ncbi:RNA polymerase sigma factor [Alicyclobacillus ferrooxydans]|uniref:RNA polymerase sigma factor n=1 Tax=Alicyclobacillus ferrooxydans TaxID=471514 RepID=A0A0N8PPY2_9BACL|nr:RNA polymerase sigma factor [Alicyclobacillus ferrooxydans]KPV45597.1 hypothetical protein AN477_01340 [Alicyclobacillus ferrooxydans]
MEQLKKELASVIDELYDLYADELYRYARFTLRDAHLAEDVVQEVFIRAIRTWDSFRGEASARTWLWHIARNYMRDVMRRKQVRNRHSVPDPVELYDVGTPFESLVELEDQLTRLTDDQRQAFVLRCMQDLSVRDTAEILGWTESKVKSTLSRALTKLREQLAEPEAKLGKAGPPADLGKAELSKAGPLGKLGEDELAAQLDKDGPPAKPGDQKSSDRTFVRRTSVSDALPDKQIPPQPTEIHEGGGPRGLERPERQI